VNHGHSRIDAEGAGFVGSRRDYAPIAGPTHHDRAPPQIRSISTFDLDKECVHIDVQDAFGESRDLHIPKVAE
jgi:hypothetical protein